MGFLSDVLAPLATAAGGALQGYASDKQTQLTQAVAQAKAAREAQNDAVMNALRMRQIQRPQLGDAGYAQLMGQVSGAQAQAGVQPKIDEAVGAAKGVAPIKVGEAVDTAKGVAPIHTQEAINTAQGVAPIHVQQAVNTAKGELPFKEQEHEAAAISSANHAVPTIQVMPGANGLPPQGVVTHGSPSSVGSTMPIQNVLKAAPAGAAGALAAPMAAKVGQAGEMLKKAGDLLPMMEGLPVSLGQSASADIAQHGVGVGSLRLPGTQGVGNALLNNNATYAQYQAALSPFVLAAAHALSGARINDTQAQQIRQSIEIAPRDITNPQVMKQKMKNMIDLVNSISGSLPPDAIGAQESQIDPAILTKLQGYGYRSSGHAKAAGNAGNPAPAGNIDLRAPTSGDPEFDAIMASLRKKP